MSLIQLFERLKIPTLLGVGIITSVTVIGVFLVLREQFLNLQISPNMIPKHITVSNITESSATISWETIEPTRSSVSYNLSSSQEKTTIDERDLKEPGLYNTHIVNLADLLPDTDYSFRISGKNKFETLTFKTAPKPVLQNTFGPVVGSVIDGDQLLKEGIVYLTVSGAVIQSASIKNEGNFLIPLNSIRKTDLSDIYFLTDGMEASLTVVSKDKKAEAIFRLSSAGTDLPTLILGQNVDLTVPPKDAAAPTGEELMVFDLNGDGFINAADNAIILKNFGKDPQNKKADINGDGVVDQKDLILMSEKIARSITQ